MSETTIAAELRSDFGKGAARQARLGNKIPAVIYGHGADPIHVLLPAQQTRLALRTANALLTLDVEGEKHLALVKDIQRNALKQSVDHLDLLTVKKGEKVQVEVSIHIEGEVASGNSLNLEHATILVEADATALPETVVANVAGRTAGQHITASELVLPEGTSLVLEGDAVIATVSALATEAEAPAESAE